jgi:hypothetical protein
MRKISAPLIAGMTLLAWGACKDEGVLYLTNVNEEPVGANCADGGNKLNFGADSDADGQLSAAEVTASAYVCNGAASRGATVTSSAIQPGDSDCPEGGYLLSVGVDRNGNGAVDLSEGGTTRKICNGAAGSDGAVGASGIEGPAGLGSTGAPGSDGATGPQGPLGLTGAPGASGPQGDPGVDGVTGPQGDQGDQGETGPQGDEGIQGLQGDAGVDGVTGPQGDQGIQGDAGPQGDQGDQGETGPQGDQGETGPQGDQGETGPQGDQGETGPQGATGASGPSGPAGATGATGASGASGPAGATGASGPSGPAGATGASGPSGPAGATGATGASGASGPAGATGATGASGPSGPAGATGATGASGPSGPAGATGATGASGPSGPAGTNGFNSLILLTAEPIGDHCADAGTKVTVGLDNGDGGGTARDGTLASGEVDQTIFLCTPQLTNFSFDSGGTGWTLSGEAFAFGGGVSLDDHGEGGFIAQDVDLTGHTAVAVSVDYTNTLCDFEGTSTFTLEIEPSGGGASVFSHPFARCDINGFTAINPSPAVIDISSVANQPVRVKVLLTTGGHMHNTINAIQLQLL